jgi:hypothetical protein
MINETWYLMVAQLVEERDSRSVFLKGYVPCKLLRKAHI